MIHRLLLCAAAAVWLTLSSSAGDRPNILLIVTDDLGWGDLGVNWQNQRGDLKHHATPNLDAMAAAGVNLRRHYCGAPVCASSRSTLLTGVHQGNAVIRDNQFDRMLEDNHTLASVLKSAGYRTSLIGKYGLQGGEFKRGSIQGSPEGWPAYPTKRGFDDFYGYVRHVDGHQHYPADHWPLGDNEKHKTPKQLWHNEVEVSAELGNCYTSDLFTAFAKKSIVESAQDDSPFFIALMYDTPHAALQLPPTAYPEGEGLDGGLQWIGKQGQMINTAVGQIDSYRHPAYVGKGWSDVEERFATSVRRIDDCIGDLRATLVQLGIDDDTIIVFTSDNGPHSESYLEGAKYNPTSFASYGPFDGIKRDCWEGGIRVPTLVQWSGHLDPGNDDSISQSQDWMATLCEAARVPCPARCDGVSLLPRWDGRRSQSLPTDMYIEYFNGQRTPKYESFMPYRQGHMRQQMQVIYEGPLKGVRYDIQSADDALEIYDIQKDPGERDNLAGTSSKFEEIERSMLQRLRQHHRDNPSAKRPYDDAVVPPEIEGGQSLVRQTIAAELKYVPQMTSVSVPQIQGAEPTLVSGIDLSDLEGFAGLVHWRGSVHVARQGEVEFAINDNLRGFLRLHRVHLIDADLGRQSRAMIKLAPGDHPFELTVMLSGEQELDPVLTISGGTVQSSAAAD